MGPAWDTAKDGIMSEEDYPYERKVLSICRYMPIYLFLLKQVDFNMRSSTVFLVLLGQKKILHIL